MVVARAGFRFKGVVHEYLSGPNDGPRCVEEKLECDREDKIECVLFGL